MFSNFLLHIGVMIGIFAMLAMSLNIALGFTGMINLSHIAFYGIGAYTSAILTKMGYGFFPSLLAGIAIAMAVAAVVTLITNKLKGDYFALGTLGSAFVVYALMLNWTSLTRGPLGIAGIKRPELFGMVLRTPESYIILVWVFVALLGLVYWLITRSRYGRVLEAIRDDAIGAAALGKPVMKMKVQAMMLAAAGAAVAGSLFAHYIRFIDPSSFYLHDIIIVLTIVIVGGLASLRGSLVAAFVIMLLPELLRFVSFPDNLLGPMRQIVYAVVLLAILLWRPRGLFGKVDLP